MAVVGWAAPELQVAAAWLIVAAASAFVGFLFAYALARIQRRWDLDRLANTERRRHIQAARVPLEIIRDEIATNDPIHWYFNFDTEEQVLRQIREACYALGDERLARLYQGAGYPLHEFAKATTYSPEFGRKALPFVQELLDRLKELENA